LQKDCIDIDKPEGKSNGDNEGIKIQQAILTRKDSVDTALSPMKHCQKLTSTK